MLWSLNVKNDNSNNILLTSKPQQKETVTVLHISYSTMGEIYPDFKTSKPIFSKPQNHKEKKRKNYSPI